MQDKYLRMCMVGLRTRAYDVAMLMRMASVATNCAGILLANMRPGQLKMYRPGYTRPTRPTTVSLEIILRTSVNI